MPSAGKAVLAMITVSLALLTGCSSTSSPSAMPTPSNAQQLLSAISGLRDAVSYYNAIPESVAANSTLHSNFMQLARRQPAALVKVEDELNQLKAMRATGYPATGMPAGMTAVSVDSAVRLYDQWVAAQKRVVHVYETCSVLTELPAYNRCVDSNLNVLKEHNQATTDLLAGLQALG